MSFELFVPERTERHAAAVPPLVTIHPSGRFTLNARALKLLGVPAKAVQVLFDKTNKRVGIRRAEPGDPGAIPVRAGGGYKSPGGAFSSMRFLRSHGIVLADGRRYEPVMSDDDMLIIDLRGPSSATVKRHREPKAAPASDPGAFPIPGWST